MAVRTTQRPHEREFASVISSFKIRLGLDIGGTFTDVALEVGERRFTAKTLTTPNAPEDGVLAAMRSATAQAGIEPQQVGLVVHGTTLATNAVIERKGARKCWCRWTCPASPARSNLSPHSKWRR